jgi:hypothetical protein
MNDHDDRQFNKISEKIAWYQFPVIRSDRTNLAFTRVTSNYIDFIPLNCWCWALYSLVSPGTTWPTGADFYFQISRIYNRTLIRLVSKIIRDSNRSPIWGFICIDRWFYRNRFLWAVIRDVISYLGCWVRPMKSHVKGLWTDSESAWFCAWILTSLVAYSLI